MPDRVLIELDGSSPRFRVSRPTKSVHSSNMGDFLIREDVPCYRAAVHGSHTFTGDGSATKTISGIAGPTFVVCRSSDYLAAGLQGIGPPSLPGWYFATLRNDTQLILKNYGNGRTIYYSVFGNPLLGD